MKTAWGLMAALVMAPVAQANPLCPPVDELIADMGNSNILPRGVSYGWAKQAYPQMSIATYDRQPQWWREQNPRYEGTWPRLMPWFVIFEGVDAEPQAVEVQVGRMAVYALSYKDNQWHLLTKDDPWEVSMCAPESNFVNCDMGTPFSGRDGLPTFMNGAQHGYGHGWFRMLTLTDPYDVKSLIITMQIRKTGPDADKASVLAHVGADFYPADSLVEGANPGAGGSKVKRIGSEWTTVSMTILRDFTGNDTGITIEALRTNAPDCSGTD